MDFVHDQMHDGRRFRILTVIDQWSRESVCLEADFTALRPECVGQALDRVAEQRGRSKAITVDNGTEFTSKALDEWAYRMCQRIGAVGRGCVETPLMVAYIEPTRLNEVVAHEAIHRRRGPSAGHSVARVPGRLHR